MIVQELHAELLPGLDGRIDPEGLVFANKVRNGGRHHQELVRRHPARLVRTPQEGLGKHGNERHRELHPHLSLLVRRESVNNTANRASCTGGVERGKDQVAGFCRPNRGFNGLKVPHFTDQDAVGV